MDNEIDQSTDFSNNETVILQFEPDEQAGIIHYNGKAFPRTKAHIFLPDTEIGKTISCPLNYFQDSSSLAEKWILNDAKQKLALPNIDYLKKVLFTTKTSSKEKIVTIPMNFSERLLDYFKLGVILNPAKYIGFDCYALISLLANVKYFPKSPAFEYEKKEEQKGDFVVLANNENLPDSIKHWALYLGNNQYFSKFGRSGDGAESHVAIMTLKGMKTLYDCEFLYVATPKKDAEPWNGLEI